MKRIFAIFNNFVLFYAVLFSGIFVLAKYILNIFNFEYRQWLFYVFSCSIIIVAIVGIIQIIKRIKNKKLKTISTVLLSSIALVCLAITSLVCIFSYKAEHIVEKDGYKFVAYVGDFFRHTYIDYYEYENIFVRTKTKRLHEFYGMGAFDPIVDESKSNGVLNFIWYNDEGVPIQE